MTKAKNYLEFLAPRKTTVNFQSTFDTINCLEVEAPSKNFLTNFLDKFCD